MDKKPTPYDYKGETVLIYPGHHFTKKELISRLKQMEWDFVDETYKKDDLIILYEIATSYPNNIEKIIVKLKKDNDYMKYKEKQQNEINKRNNINNTGNGVFPNLARKIFFSDNDDKSNQNNIGDQNESHIPSNNTSSFFTNILMKFLHNLRFHCINLGLIIMLTFGIDYYLQSISSNNYILTKLITLLRKVINKKNMLIIFLGFYIFKFIIGSILYYAFFFGTGGFLILILKEKILDFLLNMIF